MTYKNYPDQIRYNGEYYKKNKNKLIEKAKMNSKKNEHYKHTRNKNKVRARYLLRNMLKHGKIKKERCEICNSNDNLQFHHPNYENPYEYQVLCNNCHLNLHKNIRRSK